MKADYADGGFAKVCARHPDIMPSTLRTYLSIFKCTTAHDRRPREPREKKLNPSDAARAVVREPRKSQWWKAQPKTETRSEPAPLPKRTLSADERARTCRHCGALSFVVGEAHDRHCSDPRACAKRVERGGVDERVPGPIAHSVTKMHDLTRAKV